MFFPPTKYYMTLYNCCHVHVLFPQAIGSLIEVMRLMGPKYITGVKMKVLAMLRCVWVCQCECVYMHTNYMCGYWRNILLVCMRDEMNWCSIGNI